MNGHGTLQAYRNCCRCPYCRRAYRIAAERGEVRLRSGDRVREHLERLAATGWTKREIAAELGKHPSCRWAFYRLRGSDAECVPEVEQAVERVEGEYGLIGRCGWAREAGSELARGA